MKIKPVVKNLYSFLYSQIDLIFCPSKRIEKVFNQIGINNNLIVAADTRINQIINRSKESSKNIFDNRLKEYSNIVFGSIDKIDINVIVGAMNDAYPNKNEDIKNKKQKIIIVPHECDKQSVLEIVKPLKDSRFSFSFYESKMDFKDTQIIIINKTGILLIVADDAAVIIFVAPGPIDVVQTNVCILFFIFA